MINSDNDRYIQYGILTPISYLYDLVNYNWNCAPSAEGLQNFEHSDLENHTIP